MAKWHGYGRCKSRLSKDIGFASSSKIQEYMTMHTVAIAKYLESQNLIETTLAISGIGPKKSAQWSHELGIKNFALQGRGSLGERMRRQILIARRNDFPHEKRNVIVIGTDLPDLCHMDLVSAIAKLKTHDLVLGPANDGGYWLIAFSHKLYSSELFLPFTNIDWSKERVLQNTIDNVISKKIKIGYLNKKIDIDTISDLECRR